MNIAEIDQLNDLRFKIQTKNKNLSRGRHEKIPRDEMHGMDKEIPKEDTYNKYGDAAGEIEIGSIGKHGDFARMHFRKYRMGSVIERFVYAVENKPISAGYTETGEYVGEK